MRIPSEDGGAVFVFDRQGRHLRTDDVYTSKTLLQFDYDEAGLLARAVDYYANETRILRDDPAGDVVIESSIGDQRTILDMDENGNLSEVTYPGGGAEEFSYDAGGLMTAHRNRSGDEAAYVYDEDGKLISETTPDGGTQTWTREDTYEKRGWDVTHESQAGRTTRYEVSELDTGAVMSRQATVVQGGTEAEPEDLTQMTRRLKSGIVLGETPDGTQTFTMEAADPVAGMLAPYTDFTRVLLPEDDLELSMVAQKLVEREDPEDPLSRIIKLVTRSGVDLDHDFQTRYVADSNTEWDPAEVETLVASTTHFDGMSTRTETVTAEDRWTTAFYSERGELIRTEAGTLYPSEFEYDEMGYLTRSIAAPGTADEAATEFGYNVNGLLEITTDTLGRVVTNSYDERNLLVGVDLDGEASLAFDYDEDDILTTVTLPHGEVHRFYHDAMYRPTAYYPPALLSGDTPTTFSWNLDGQQERVEYADDANIDYVYDFAGRLEKVHGFDGTTTKTVEYTYNPSTNQLTDISVSDGRRLAYEHNGPLLTSEAWDGPTTESEWVKARLDYTLDDRLRMDTVKVTSATGGDDWTSTYTYDDADGLITQTSMTRIGETPRHSNVTYDENAAAVTSELVEGSTVLTTSTLEYDDLGRVIQAHSARGVYHLADCEYEYDTAGRIETATELFYGGDGVQHDYGYDVFGHLSAVEIDESAARTYTYDLNGNRLSKYDAEAGSVTYYRYDAQDRLLQTTDTLNSAEFEYEYSDRGVLTAKEDSNSGDRTEYQYDAFGNLLKVRLHAGDVTESEIEYVVDGAGRRIGQKKDGVWTNKYAAGAELTADTSELVSVFIPGGMISLKDTYGDITSTWTTYKIIKDSRGSVRVVLDAATGEVAQEINYDEFGSVTFDSNPGFQPLGFAGGVYDHETGLVRFGTRDYDAQVGRWTAKDSLGFGGGYNLYAYCNNDPVNFVDPLGFGWSEDIGNLLDIAAAGVRGGLQGLAGGLDGAISLVAFGFMPLAALGLYNTNAPGVGFSQDVGFATALVLSFMAPFVGGEAVAAESIASEVVAAESAVARATAAELGKAGEAAVRAVYDIGKKEAITIGENLRIPDGINRIANVLSEVKNVARQSYTRQLKDYAGYAADNGLRFDLYVRNTTKLTGPLKNAITEGLINLRYIP